MNAIETYVLEQIGENTSSPDVFVEGSEDLAFLRRAIHDGITETCIATGAYQSTYLLYLRAGRNFYRLRQTRDVMLYPVEVLDRSNSRKLFQTSFAELASFGEWMQDTGYPTHYWQVSHDVIGIWRAPSDSGRVLELRCISVPKEYDAEKGEEPRLRDQFQKAVAHYALSEYYASRGDAGRGTENYKAFLELAGLQKYLPDRDVILQKGGVYAFSRQ